MLPHGMQIIPGLEEPYNENFRSLHEAMVTIQHDLLKNSPDIIILISPHAHSLDERYVVYHQAVFQGSYFKVSNESVVYGDHVTTKTWTGDPSTAKKISEKLLDNGIPTSSLIHGYSEYPLVLAWGESVPLYYIAKENQPKLVIISIPRTRFEKIQEIQAELMGISNVLVQYAVEAKESVCIVFSGDLSHVHQEQGPYGYHVSCKEFDDLVQAWAKEPSFKKLDRLLYLQSTALACGMAGISILQGMLSKLHMTNDFLSYDVPTYFGMVVTRWRPD
ncbi:MAG: DODA-type extradiol aromatic ring-opening family dioxygenase [Candidatus Kariarchaeaceae archaeon]